MKKFFFIVIAILIVLIISVYLFIPVKINFTYTIVSNCTESGAERLIINKDLWKKWWPGTKKEDNIYTYKSIDLRIDKVLLNGLETSVLGHNSFAKAYVQVFSTTDSTSKFMWSQTAVLPGNPIERVIQYFKIRNTESEIEDLMNDIKLYFDNEQNIYGFKTAEQKVKDSSLIAIKKTFTHYPSSVEIYDLIKSVRNFISTKGGKVVDYPILNIYESGLSNFKAMIAIPVEKDLLPQGDFELKKMLLGNIITAEIKGGENTIRKSENELANYIQDYKRVSPAIPYQSLVTDRLMEKDTSKWITRLYYPVYRK